MIKDNQFLKKMLKQRYSFWSKLQEYLNTCFARKITIKSIVSEPEPTEKLESLLVHAFCSTGIPFNIIENIDFQAFLQKACPSFHIPLHHTLSAKGIEECMLLIGIDKFMAVITDNANNIKLVWRILKEKYADKIFLKSTLQRIQKEKYEYEIALTLTVETRWMSMFECLDHILKTKIAIRALLAEENIILNQKIKNYIIDDCFWEELKNLCDFLELFINFIRKLEEDESYLSSSRYSLLSSVAIKILSIPAFSATKLEVPLTVKELIKSVVKMSDLESDDEKLSEESDKKQEDDIDSNVETLTEYEENEFDLDFDN
ncbi:hypothetical protein C1645_835566 [Glomus cerebriforme]|uniref:HAT C-terminal dimerisation domain-containing protein n=1 Tax=Glomus cerebriforme TaxID=658196 RepID=A0A397SIH8_9GLOM|nr:hypothetical protein C1645_835566 [Glomus cerebriforme]